VLKCDIKKYFSSIDHEILKSLIRRRIADDQTLWLIDRIIDGSNLQEEGSDYFPADDLFAMIERRKGLPIGNLTSQFFANLYLNPLDHFVKERLRCRAYLRYVDDFALLANSKAVLWKWRKQIAIFLQSLRLKLHPQRCYIFPARVGWLILGQRVFHTHRLLAAQNVRNFKRRLRTWGQSPPENLRQRLASWAGHAAQADTFHLLRTLGIK